MGHFGITICLEALNGSFNIGYYKVKIGKNDKLREQTSFILRCPFVNCLKKFTDTGNLKTHLRTHVIYRLFKTNRPVIVHIFVRMQVVRNNFLPKGI